MDYNTLQRMVLDGTVYQADLPTLTACLQFANGQPDYIDPRLKDWRDTLRFLISERQQQERHKEEIERTTNAFANTSRISHTGGMVDKRKALNILEELKARIPSLARMSAGGMPAFIRWRHAFETAIVQIFPNDNSRYCAALNGIAFVHKSTGAPGTNENAVATGLDYAEALVQAMIDHVREYWSESGTSVNPQGQQAAAISAPLQARDPKAVFVVHGRNEAIRDAMFTFLRAIGLKPVEWSKVRAATNDPNPYVGDILNTAFSDAQAFVIVMTPDDEACLKAEFRNDNDPVHETELTGQPRQNVLFESGMAMGYDSKRTVLVEIGALRPFSDTIGRHTVRLDNTSVKRKELAQRLKTAGCPVDLEGNDWLSAGSFEVQQPPQSNKVRGPSEPRTQKLDLISESIQDSKEPLEQDARNILSYVFRNGPCAVAEIKKHVFDDKIHRGVVQHHCNELLGRKLIEISVETEKSEIPEYIITPKGIKFVHSTNT
jgi:predicted nucleotide-binding protein